MARAFSDAELTRIRGLLVAAGADALPHTGLRGTRIGTLTRKVGISKGAFYTFFPSKEALWMAVLQQAEDVIRAELLWSVEGPGSPEDVLERTLRLLFTVTDRTVMVVMQDPADLAWLMRVLPEGVLEAAGADDERWFTALWAKLVDRGCGDPDLDPTLFAGLAPVSLALAQGRELIGVSRSAAMTDLFVSALVVQLMPTSPRV